MIIPLLRESRWTVLANGAFPTHEIPLSFLKEAKEIICCDGAVQNLVEYELTPDFIIGDMDSISDELQTHFRFHIIKDDSQETNDLTKALHFCHKCQIYEEITIIGATGKREDHTLGNLSLLANFTRKMKIQLLTDYGVFVPIWKTATFESYPKQQVSIFNLTPGIAISSTDLVYPLKNRPLKHWWEGTLNEATGNQFTITINYLHFQPRTANILVFREY